MATVANCGLADATITATGSGGTAPYQYSIGGGFQASPIFPNVASGQYTVTIKDNAGLTATAVVNVVNDCMTLGTNTMTAICGQANGSLTVTVTGGTLPYQYSIDGVNFQTSPAFNNIVGGAYTVTVKDANNTLATIMASVGDIQGPQVGVSVQAASCLNNDGELNITVMNGTPPYQYSVGGGTYGSNYLIGGLASGLQTAFVMDANGCVSSTTTAIPLNDNLELAIAAKATSLPKLQGQRWLPLRMAVRLPGARLVASSSTTVPDPTASPAVTTPPIRL